MLGISMCKFCGILKAFFVVWKRLWLSNILIKGENDIILSYSSFSIFSYKCCVNSYYQWLIYWLKIKRMNTGKNAVCITHKVMQGLAVKSSVYCFTRNYLEFLVCWVSTFVWTPQVSFLKTYLGYLLLSFGKGRIAKVGVQWNTLISSFNICRLTLGGLICSVESKLKSFKGLVKTEDFAFMRPSMWMTRMKWTALGCPSLVWIHYQFIDWKAVLFLCTSKWVNRVLYRKWESIKSLCRQKLEFRVMQHVSAVACIHDNDARLSAICWAHSREMEGTPELPSPVL